MLYEREAEIEAVVAAAERARAKDGRLVVEQPYTQQELAQRVGCSREVVSRIFKDLVAGGYIRLDGRRIQIERPLPTRW